MAFWMIMGALADMMAWLEVISSSRPMAMAVRSRSSTLAPVCARKARPLRRAIHSLRRVPARSSSDSNSFMIMRWGRPSMARDTMMSPGFWQST